MTSMPTKVDCGNCGKTVAKETKTNKQTHK